MAPTSLPSCSSRDRISSVREDRYVRSYRETRKQDKKPANWAENLGDTLAGTNEEPSLMSGGLPPDDEDADHSLPSLMSGALPDNEDDPDNPLPNAIEDSDGIFPNNVIGHANSQQESHEDDDEPVLDGNDGHNASSIHPAGSFASNTTRYSPWFASRSEVGIVPTWLVALLTLLFPVWLFLGLPVFPFFNFGSSMGPGFAGAAWTALVFSILGHWAPIALIVVALTVNDPWRRSTRILLVASGVAAFGLVSWGYFVAVSNTTTTMSLTFYPLCHALNNPIFNTSQKVYPTSGERVHWAFQFWHTGFMPRSPLECKDRVASSQALLFSPATYNTQFARTYYEERNSSICRIPWYVYPAFDMDMHRKVKDDQALCSNGFLGNTDLYGLGIRVGLYLQWVASLLANNLLSATRAELQTVYLMFNVAICLATVIASSLKRCIFGIEVELLYWMYWGGYLCVFGCAPCPIQLGKDTKWIEVDWMSVILFVTHSIMSYHGVWFCWHAYDQVFARMPCGTWHFLFAPVLDPSEVYWVLRDWMGQLSAPLLALLCISIPAIAVLMVAEVMHAIRAYLKSISLFGTPVVANSEQNEDHLNDGEESDSDESKAGGTFPYIYRTLKSIYMGIREAHGFPRRSRGGIRLVTPIDVKDRKLYRIRWAVMGLLSCVSTITAIELLLKWNGIVGVNSAASTGQYLPLIMGLGSFISVCWKLWQQEIERRSRLNYHQAMEGEDGLELQTMTAAITYAFAQPDAGFLSNDGAFPDAVDGDVADLPLTRPISLPPGPEYTDA